MADFGKLNPLAMANALRGIAPHGFRHVESVEDVSVPKGSGWFGYLPNQAGGVSTEISSNNDNMAYPMLNPAMSRQEINSLLANQQPTDAMYNRAEQWANYRKEQGKSPFLEMGELRWPMPQE